MSRVLNESGHGHSDLSVFITQVGGLEATINFYGSHTDIAEMSARRLMNAWWGDVEVRRQNGTYWKVTLFEPSYEHIGDGDCFSRATLIAARRAVKRYEEITARWAVPR